MGDHLDGRSSPAPRRRSSTRRSSPTRSRLGRHHLPGVVRPSGGPRTGAEPEPPRGQLSRVHDLRCRPGLVRGLRAARTDRLGVRPPTPLNPPAYRVRRPRRRGRLDRAGSAGHEHDVGGDDGPRVHHRERERSGRVGGLDADRPVWRASHDPGRAISAIYVDPANAHHAWISYNGYNVNTPTQPGHVFEVTWSGSTATWMDVQLQPRGPPHHGRRPRRRDGRSLRGLRLRRHAAAVRHHDLDRRRHRAADASKSPV